MIYRAFFVIRVQGGAPTSLKLVIIYAAGTKQLSSKVTFQKKEVDLAAALVLLSHGFNVRRRYWLPSADTT